MNLKKTEKPKIKNQKHSMLIYEKSIDYKKIRFS